MRRASTVNESGGPARGLGEKGRCGEARDRGGMDADVEAPQSPLREGGWGDIRRRAPGQAEKLLPQPQVWVALGLLKTNPRPITSSLKSSVTPLR